MTLRLITQKKIDNEGRMFSDTLHAITEWADMAAAYIHGKVKMDLIVQQN